MPLSPLADAIFEDSGLVATIVMGVALANQRRVRIDYIAEFKETLVPLLIGILFVLLAANVDVDDVIDLGLPVVALILILVLVVRPLAVAGLAGLGFTRSERVFFAAMAPRGIVAASTASAFGLKLTEDGVQGAELIIPITFAVIAGTVFIYGFGSPPLARYLGLAGNRPPALLLVGAPRWALALGAALTGAGARSRSGPKTKTKPARRSRPDWSLSAARSTPRRRRSRPCSTTSRRSPWSATTTR